MLDSTREHSHSFIENTRCCLARIGWIMHVAIVIMLVAILLRAVDKHGCAVRAESP